MEFVLYAIFAIFGILLRLGCGENDQKRLLLKVDKQTKCQ